MTQLCWIDRERRSAAEQMAIDLAAAYVAIDQQFTVTRWYQWERDTLSLGTHEAAHRTWNRARLEEDSIAVVRRPTGGRGVWHAADDLTYAWCGPIASRREGSIRYREIHESMAGVLRANGIAARVNGEAAAPADLSPGACFDLSIGGEIVVEGRKAVGAAQRYLPGGLLQHGAIARSDHRATEDRYLLAEVRPARSSQEEWPDAAALAEALEREGRRLGAEPIPPATRELIESRAAREVSTFADPEWTWRR